MDPWRSAKDNTGDKFALREPEKYYNKPHYLVLLTGRYNLRFGNLPTCPNNSKQFGPFPHPIATILINYTEYTNTQVFDCYVVASLKISAGMFHSHNSSIVGRNVVKDSTTDIAALMPDQLLPDAFFALPDVMHTISLMNSSSVNQMGRQEAYVKTILTQSYFGIWTSMAEYFRSNERSGAVTHAAIPTPVVRAQVTVWRMWLWLGLNLLVTISGTILYILQICCGTKPTSDTVLTALMLDPSRILERDNYWTVQCCSVAGEEGDGEGDTTLEKWRWRRTQ